MISSYLEQLPQERQDVILKLRELVLKHLPSVNESLHYKMPTYRVGDKDVLAFAAQKHYYSVYLMNLKLKAKYADDFAHLNVGKSCIRFKKLEQFPLDSFEKILKEIKTAKG